MVVKNAAQEAVEWEWYTSKNGNPTVSVRMSGWVITVTVFPFENRFKKRRVNQWKYCIACDGWRYFSKRPFRSEVNAMKAAKKVLEKYGPGKEIACVRVPWPSRRDLFRRIEQ